MQEDSILNEKAMAFSIAIALASGDRDRVAIAIAIVRRFYPLILHTI